MLIVLSIIVLLTSIFFTFFVGISYAIDNYNKFDDTKVIDDLQSATVKGKPFALDNYRPDKDKRLEMIHFAEYCYSYKKNMQSNYGLYVYIYNPKQIVFDEQNIGNKIQIATEFNNIGEAIKYEKFDLTYCNKSEDDATFRNVFYKFKIKQPDKLLSVVEGKELRQYNISGVELVPKGGQVTETEVAHTYSYNGYAKGYGTNMDMSTLSCAITNLETIELSLKSTEYRTATSGAGFGHQNQLNSVYFSVPNRFYDNYGELNSITASWYEAKTQPMWVLDNSALSSKIINRMKPYLGVDTGGQNKSIPYAVATDYSYIASPGGGSVESMGIGYNMDIESKYVFPYTYSKHCDYEQRRMTTMLQIPAGEDIKKYGVPSSAIKENWYNLSKDLPASELLQGVSNKYSKHLFQAGVDSGRTPGKNEHTISNKDRINLLSYDDTHNAWELLLNYGFSKPKDESIVDKPPIFEVKASDLVGTKEEIAKKLLVNINDIDDIIAQYAQDKLLGKRTTLFRFASTDYFSSKAYVFEYENPGFIPQGAGFSYLAQETVFLDFDIISLTFLKDADYTTIPVVASPIDIISGITPPLDFGNEDCDWLCILKKILMIVAIIIVILLLLPFLPWIVSIVIAVVKLPFKLVGAVFKGVKKSGSKGGKSPPEHSSNNAKVKYDGDDKQLARERFKKE